MGPLGPCGLPKGLFRGGFVVPMGPLGFLWGPLGPFVLGLWPPWVPLGPRILLWLGWLACCALPWLGLAWACLACLASNNNSGGAAAAGRRRRPVVVAGKAGKTGPGQTKPRLGTTGKPAKPKQATTWILIMIMIMAQVIKVSRFEIQTPLCLVGACY